MIEFFNRVLMDWILAIKNNVSNSVAEVAIMNYLNKHKDTYEYFHCEKVEKTVARIEVRRYNIIPISVVELCQQALLKPGTKPLIRVEKETYSHLKDDNKNIKDENMTEEKPTVSTLYFISSLDYNEDNCKQIVHSLRNRWLYESQHNTLDTVMFQDNQHCCDENHLAAITGLNSMVYNIVSFA
uniref:hypothetical protein n=1 Tax=Succinivibrio sp. TaxID=2053619 RepID=UPI00402B04EF